MMVVVSFVQQLQTLELRFSLQQSIIDPKRVICLDADGVLLDYTAAYGKAWKRAFGSTPAVANIDAYWPWDYWNVGQLSGADLIGQQFSKMKVGNGGPAISVPPRERSYKFAISLLHCRR